MSVCSHICTRISKSQYFSAREAAHGYWPSVTSGERTNDITNYVHTDPSELSEEGNTALDPALPPQVRFPSLTRTNFPDSGHERKLLSAQQPHWATCALHQPLLGSVLKPVAHVKA